MRVCFLTAGPPEWASSRMRAYWPASAMDDALAVPIQQVERDLQETGEIPAADVYVFQKLYSSNIRAAMPQDAAVVWDVCDPVWWFDPEGSREALDNVHLVTASTGALANDLFKWAKESMDYSPIISVIPDCIDLSHFPVKATHTDHTPIRFIWFGIYANRVALHAAQAYLERLVADGYSIQLTIMDERPDIPHVFTSRVSFPIYFTEWSLERENEVLAAHDIALLPRYPGPWGLVKSDNKRMTAAACGLPVTNAQNYDELTQLVASAEVRGRRVPVHSTPGTFSGWTVGRIAPLWEQIWELRIDLSGDERERAVSVEDTAVLAAG